MAEMKSVKSALSSLEFGNVLGEPVRILYNPGDVNFRKKCEDLYAFANTESEAMASKEKEASDRIAACESDEEKFKLQMESTKITKEFCNSLDREIDSLLGQGTCEKVFCGYQDPIAYADFIDILGESLQEGTKTAVQKYAKHPANKKK